MAAEGSDRRRASRDAGPFGALHWSPDGAYLAWIATAAVGAYEGVARGLHRGG